MSKTSSFAVRAGEIWKIILKAARHVLFHNGWVKLLALLISLLLWAGLISQDESLTRDRTWQNVNISVTGEDALKRSGYIVVSDLEELLSNVSVTAAVPQKQYESADATVYNLRVDLSRLKGTGTQELKILSTTSSVYGRVTSTVPASLNVDVEEYIQRSIPVSTKVNGDNQNGWYKEWYISNQSVDPTRITVSGPRDLAQKISKAGVYIDLDKLEMAEGTLLTTGEIVLQDRYNNEISNPLLSLTSEGSTIAIDTVMFEANILPTKSFNISDMIDLHGEVKKGYKVASCKVSPETITVAARNEVLEQMDEPALDRNINLENLEETTVFQIKVRKPSEDAVLSNETITVTVEIEKEE